MAAAVGDSNPPSGLLGPTETADSIMDRNSAVQSNPIKEDLLPSMMISEPRVLDPALDISRLKETMAGKKILSLERPDDNARHLASTLTLEEQVHRPMHTLERLLLLPLVG